MKTINQIRNRRKKGVKKEREAYAALSQSEVRHLNKARSQHVESYVHPVSINVDDVFTPVGLFVYAPEYSLLDMCAEVSTASMRQCVCMYVG